MGDLGLRRPPGRRTLSELDAFNMSREEVWAEGLGEAVGLVVLGPDVDDGDLASIDVVLDGPETLLLPPHLSQRRHAS